MIYVNGYWHIHVQALGSRHGKRAANQGFPTNFILQDDILYDLDYECKAYMEEWVLKTGPYGTSHVLRNF